MSPFTYFAILALIISNVSSYTSLKNQYQDDSEGNDILADYSSKPKCGDKEVGKIYVGTDIAILGTTDFSECAEKCLDNYQCEGASRSAITGSCVLYSYVVMSREDVNSTSVMCLSEEEKHDRYRRDLGSGGPSVCNPTVRQERDIFAPSAEITTLTNQTNQTCCDECDTRISNSSDSCAGFAFNSTTGECKLYQRVLYLTSDPNLDAFICESTESTTKNFTCTATAEVNKRLRGTYLLNSVSFALDVSVCKARCENDFSCVGYDFDTIRCICALFRATGETVAAANFNTYLCAGRNVSVSITAQDGDIVVENAQNVVGTASTGSGRRKRETLTEVSYDQCRARVLETDATAWVMQGLVVEYGTCEIYSEMSYLTPASFDTTSYYLMSKSLTLSWGIVNDCLAEAGLTKTGIEDALFGNQVWWQRWQTCREYPKAINCILTKIDKCYDPANFAKDIFDFMSLFYDRCRFFQHPGICPSPVPTCANTLAPTKSCTYFTFEYSFTDGEVTRQFTYKRGYHSQCPFLHRCCPDANGNGVCRRAQAPPDNCDLDKAATCRPRQFFNAKFVSRGQFCTDYVTPYHECFVQHTSGCTEEALAEFDVTWNYRRELQSVVNAVAFCSYAPCNPNPCFNGAVCQNLYDVQLTQGDEEMDLWEAQLRLWTRVQPPSYKCICAQGFSGDRCQTPECTLMEVNLDLPGLFQLVGDYQPVLTLQITTQDVTYKSESITFGFSNQGGILLYIAVDNTVVFMKFEGINVVRLLVINASGVISEVNPDSGLDVTVGQQVKFAQNCYDGKGYLFENGVHQKDKTLADTNTASNPFKKFPLESPIRIGCESYSNICVFVNGHVTFTNADCPAWQGERRNQFPIFPGLETAQFAVFGALQGFHLFTGAQIYLGQTFTANSNNIIRATQQVRQLGENSFEARQVITVTWDRVSPRPLTSQTTPYKTNTYQAVFISDFVHTYVFYNHANMEATSDVYFIETVDSSTIPNLQLGVTYKQQSSMYVWNGITGSVGASSRAQYIIDNGNQNYVATSIGRPISGKQFYSFNVTDSSCQVAVSECKKWILEKSLPSFPIPETDQCEILDICPPSEIFPIAMGWQCITGDPGLSLRTCYRSNRRIWYRSSAGRTLGMARTLCCYENTVLQCKGGDTAGLTVLIDRLPELAGSLITSMDLAGVTQFYSYRDTSVTYSVQIFGFSYSRTRTVRRYSSTDLEGWNTCCGPTTTHTVSDCELFYNFRRISTSRCFVPRTIAFMRGDPHFTTLDGKTYTFNGCGEYVLLQTRDMNTQIQTRTVRTVDVNGTMLNATQFSAIAIYQNGADKLQFMVENSTDRNSELIMLAGPLGQQGSPVQLVHDSNDEDLAFGTASVHIHNNRSVTVGLDGGWSIDIQVALGIMLFVISVPENQRGQVVGLMGTFNNNTDDDFERPDGTTLSINATDEDIHNRFGQKWAVTNTTTLFQYFAGVDSFDSINKPDFVPTFNNLSAVSAEAKDICGDDPTCLYDYEATKDQSIAVNTATANKNINNDTAILANTAPTITFHNGTTVIFATGVPATLVFEATDKDGDPVTVMAADGFSTLCINTITENTVQIDTSKLKGCRIALTGSDGKVKSENYDITIVECPSCVHGTCDLSTVQIMTDATNPYHKSAACSCNLGYTGEKCEVRVNPCDSKPCGQRQCTQLTEAQIAANNNSLGYDCACLFEEVSVGGQCFQPAATNTTETPTAPDDGLSREMIIVITVCVIVVVMGLGLIIIYAFSSKMAGRGTRQRFEQEDSSSGGTTSFYAPRMNTQGWFNGGGYGNNPMRPYSHQAPRSFEHRPLYPANHGLQPTQPERPGFPGLMPTFAQPYTPSAPRSAGWGQANRSRAGWNWTAK